MATLSTDPLLSAVAGFPQQPLLLTEKDVAALLQCSVRLLQQWRAEGVSPPTWMALGQKLIRYPADALVTWVRSGVGTTKVPRGLAARTIAPVGDGLFAPDWSAAGFDEPPFRGGRKPKVRHACWCALKTDHPCALKIDQGWKPRGSSPGRLEV